MRGRHGGCRRAVSKRELDMARQGAFFSGLVVFAASFSTWAVGATQGSIAFVGAVVAPPHEIRVAPVAPALAPAASAAGASVQVRFSPSSSQSASVRAEGLGRLPVALRCIGAKLMSTDGCHLGPEGGTILVVMRSALAAGMASGTLLTVAYD
jgi:hypothetical protein